MKLLLAEVDGPAFINDPVRTFERLAAIDKHGVHTLVDDPEIADAILFTQCHMLGDLRLRAIRDHPLTRQYPHKVRVYDERDRPYARYRGLYVSLEQGWLVPGVHRAWAYATVPSVRLLETGAVRSDARPDLLFSFIGSRTARCRNSLYAIEAPDAVVEDSTGIAFYDHAAPGYDDWRRRFEDVLLRSRFVLCPRGTGTSSIRLYEALALGRVPVIISDRWVPPGGPDWSACSLRWPEGRTDGLVDMLTRADTEWEAFSAEAKRVFTTHFAEPTAWHNMVEELRRLDDGAPRAARWARTRNLAGVTPHLGYQATRRLAGLVAKRVRRRG